MGKARLTGWVVVLCIILLALPAYAGLTPAGLQGQDILSLTEDPGEGTAWYAGTASGEVYKYIDGGAGWALASYGLPGGSGVLSLAISPLSPDTVFAGLDGDGVYKSSDGGATWTLSGLDGLVVRDIAVDPYSSSIVFAVTPDALYRSIDGGTNWQQVVSAVISSADIRDVVFNAADYTQSPLPTATDAIYVASADGLYWSGNGGSTWSAVDISSSGAASAALNMVAVDQLNTSVIYAGTADAGMLKSSDGGNTWAFVNDGLDSQNITTIAFYVWNTTSLLAGTADGKVYRTDNGGETWYLFNSGNTATKVNEIGFISPQTVYILAATDDGVFSFDNSLPDLVVSAVSGKTESDSVSITYTLKNTGATNAGNFWIAFYLSNDTSITLYDHYIGDQYISYLGAGQEKTVTVTIKPRINIPYGPLYIGAYADWGDSYHRDRVHESNEANNGLAGDLLDYYQDLQITAISGVRNGENLEITYTVKSAAANAGNFWVAFYLSNDTTITLSDQYIGDQYISYLGAGQEKTVTVTIKPRINIPYGPLYIGAYADWGDSYHRDRVHESNEANNGLAGDLLDYYQDLQITAISGVQEADYVSITYTLKSAAANAGNFWVIFYLSKDTTLTFYDYYIGEQPVSYLGAGQEKTITVKYKIPVDLPAGSYYVGAYADWGGPYHRNKIHEVNETNNSLVEGQPSIGNSVPIANAGGDQVMEATGPYGALVLLDGSGSTDADGDALTYTWTGSFGTATGLTPSVQLVLGSHTITLTVDDGKGGTDTDTLVITVVDTTAPVITILGVQDGAQYALGQVPVASYTATDSGSGLAASSDSLTGGDGLGLGVFTYSVTAEDTAGNIATASVTYEVISTTSGTQALIEQMIADGLIAPELKTSMFAKINNGSDGSLSALINQIEAQRGKKISDEAADILINAIQYMIDNN